MDRNLPKRPNRLLIWAVKTFSQPSFERKYGLTIDRSALDGVKPPYIVLFNHVGDDDHMIVGMTLYPQLANYMVSRWVLHKFPTGPLSVLAGAIHKARFTPDIDAVLAAKRVLCKRKGIVAIAPAASFSLDGTPHYFDYGIAKFVKLFRVPVFAVRISGLFTFHNGYRETRNTSKLKSEVIPVYNGDELADLDVVEVYKRLFTACYFNDSDYAKATPAVVSSNVNGLAEGMEYLTYRCLRCGAEYQIRPDGDLLVCGACGNRVRVNNRFLLEPVDANDHWVESFDQWNTIQRQQLLLEISRDNFGLAEPCTLSHYTLGKRYGISVYGTGMLTLDKTGVTYTGTDMGKEVVYHYPLESTPYLGNFIPYYLSADTKDNTYRFALDDMHKAVKYLQALLLLRLLYYPNFPDEMEWRMQPQFEHTAVIHIGQV